MTLRTVTDHVEAIQSASSLNGGFTTAFPCLISLVALYSGSYEVTKRSLQVPNGGRASSLDETGKLTSLPEHPTRRAWQVAEPLKAHRPGSRLHRSSSIRVESRRTVFPTAESRHGSRLSSAPRPPGDRMERRRRRLCLP